MAKRLVILAIVTILCGCTQIQSDKPYHEHIWTTFDGVHVGTTRWGDVVASEIPYWHTWPTADINIKMAMYDHPEGRILCVFTWSTDHWILSSKEMK